MLPLDGPASCACPSKVWTHRSDTFSLGSEKGRHLKGKEMARMTLYQQENLGMSLSFGVSSLHWESSQECLHPRGALRVKWYWV